MSSNFAVLIPIQVDKHLIFRMLRFNPLNPEFTIVIIIHYKPRIAAAILDL